jgi:iron complex transport system ATP-binding protein
VTDVVDLHGVEVVRGGRRILGPIDLAVPRGEHLAVLGPNGSGKTTLLRILSTYLHPTRGTVEVLGGRFGRVDVRALRGRVGVVSAGVVGLLHRVGSVSELVAAARHGATRPVPAVDDTDRDAAAASLARVGADHLVDRVCRTLSQGEWQRVQIARALVTDPELLLLDEPFAGLDLGGREALVGDVARVMEETGGPTVVLVTHHVEEIPDGVRLALLLREGRPVAAGRAVDVLTSTRVSSTFDVAVDVDHDRGRYRARLTP